MFDISTVSKRYFSIKLTVTDAEDQVKSIELEVEPPKVKMLKKLVAVERTATENAMDELAEVTRKMLSKNKAKYDVPIEYIDDLDYDQLKEILTAYFAWLRDNQNSPN